MVVNEQEHDVTKGWIRRFEGVLDRPINNPDERNGVHPKLHKARIAQARGLLDDLRQRAAEYEALH
jgi:hypothetical protein